jgi:hypothetical protein
MPVIKPIWIILFVILLAGGCVEPFFPDELATQKLLEIDGTITDREGYHYIRISWSSNYQNPQLIPKEGCQVEVLSRTGIAIQFSETNPGLYMQWIDQGIIQTGEDYKVRVVTENSTYESDFETMIPCAPVGEVYYLVEDKETDDPAITLQGIQYYTDLNAPEGYARNYRWELEETWEYHSEYPIRFYWDGTRIVDLGHTADSLFYCWSSGSIREIYTASMQYISGDSLTAIPLRYVSNETDRLTVKYCLLVKQYSLSEQAYNYWNQLQKLSQETGGLYETQPPQIRGNIHNINDENEIVLGNFNVSAMTEKRIFTTEKFSFFTPSDKCELWLPIEGLSAVKWPMLLHPDERGLPMLADPQCFDCTMKGGTTIKPESWE